MKLLAMNKIKTCCLILLINLFSFSYINVLIAKKNENRNHRYFIKNEIEQIKLPPNLKREIIYHNIPYKKYKKLDKSSFQSDTISITYDDFIRAYTPTNNLQIFYSPEDSLYKMDIGIVDYENSQNWILPNATLTMEDFQTGVAPNETPYFEYFPFATHCRKSTFPDEIIYDYYEFSPESIYLVGEVFEDLVDSTVTIDTTEFLITPLPLEISTSFIAEDSVQIGPTEYLYVKNIIDPQGFGNLQTPFRSSKVLKIYYGHIYRYYVNDILVRQDTTHFYVFVDKNLNQLTLTIKDGSTLTGLTDVYDIEYKNIDYTNSVSQENEIPNDFILYQNYPNPFNPSTTIKYYLPKSDYVTLKIYDVIGREINTLVNSYQSPGNYTVDFSAVNLCSGVYFYELKGSKFRQTKKMLVLK